MQNIRVCIILNLVLMKFSPFRSNTVSNPQRLATHILALVVLYRFGKVINDNVFDGLYNIIGPKFVFHTHTTI